MLLHIKIKEWLRLPEKSAAESVPLAAVIDMNEKEIVLDL